MGSKGKNVKGKVELAKLNLQDKIALLWFSLDATTHLTIELAYVILALTTTAERSDTYMGWIWREYGRADARWAVRDPTIISLEIITVFLGFLCLMQMYGIIKKAPWRHPLQVIICVAELYGGWVTFAPEWVEGSPSLDGSTFSLFWVYLVFMNGLWVVIPLLLLWDSFSRITSACATSAYPVDLGFPCAAPSKRWWLCAAALLLAYMILVPGVLFSATGVPVRQ